MVAVPMNRTLIIIVSFIPLFFLSGMEGRMLVPLGISFVHVAWGGVDSDSERGVEHVWHTEDYRVVGRACVGVDVVELAHLFNDDLRGGEDVRGLLKHVPHRPGDGAGVHVAAQKVPEGQDFLDRSLNLPHVGGDTTSIPPFLKFKVFKILFADLISSRISRILSTQIGRASCRERV